MKMLSACLCGSLLLLAGLARADESFQMTVASVLRHDRLEVSVGMSLETAALLVEDPGNPEAPRLDAGNFAARREQLERQAMGLYEVSAGGAPLVPRRAIASLAPSGAVQCVVIYPSPTGWPLRIRARPWSNLPAGAAAVLEMRDQDEKSLGQKVLSPRDPANVELSVAPAGAVVATPSPPAAIRPPATPVPKVDGLPEFGVVLGIAVTLAAATAFLVLFAFRKSAGTWSRRR